MIAGIAKDCLVLISQKLSREISLEEYYEALKGLATKYPLIDFSPRAEKHKRVTRIVDRKSLAGGEREAEER